MIQIAAEHELLFLKYKIQTKTGGNKKEFTTFITLKTYFAPKK